MELFIRGRHGHAGVVLFHRSGDQAVGVHGNSAARQPSPDTHRIALVLYQTDLKVKPLQNPDLLSLDNEQIDVRAPEADPELLPC